jgi:hypothetical protein
MESSRDQASDGCPLVLIEWEDSTQPQGRWQWLSSVEMPRSVRCLSVGFLIRDTATAKTLAPNLGNVDCEDDVQASGLISIPARAIIRISRVKEIKGRNVIRFQAATQFPTGDD